MKTKKPINIYECIDYRSDGTWTATYYQKSKVVYKSDHAWWSMAILDIEGYFIKNNINYTMSNREDWFSYFNKCVDHIKYMAAKKGKVSNIEWDMAYFCDAPNKPGYEYANNH